MRSYQRGFFCTDLTIRYPYHECTITVAMLLVCMLLLPMLFLSIVEIMRLCHNFRLRQYMRNSSFSLGCFSFGFIATYLTTEMAKNVIQRLRPHFYLACQPRLSEGNSCEDLDNRNIYVEQYYCSNRNLSSRQIRELYVSFPSAHSSLSFYSMLFLAFYLHAVWRGRGIMRVLRHLLQFGFLSLAWFISLSRVADYWHHWSDVVAGAVMGVVYATLTALYVGRFLHYNQHACGASGTGGVSNNNNTHLHQHSILSASSNKPFKRSTQHVGSMVSFKQASSNLEHNSLTNLAAAQTSVLTTPTTAAAASPLTHGSAAAATPMLSAAASPTASVSSTSLSLQTTANTVKEHLISASNEYIWKSGT